ncbi:PREDICTED: AT-hook motif nuclear-localized protein 9-like isoform X1 [Lupinus angustifolius]|uniref:AT-hook motif nuclear-localized protein 9-like isoform X1 n=1 Tax=Lupinus angustifolius TaxID=3871 RepID=UPI00092FCB1C|nr:PREDICTED: AT-hook motif nuclear-localized protein 9-like isoform X1 [Lupinus angustifolius]XP_019460593.1 PREDICTED: AT-hook motif nuclear-localized protein 9-like isoform X1 [Lupinus angustifolius]XP_019460594.1 PREDICTED: AT-hook motif nuclear-localized protein 9-like isoform X1 [Lupinus angustifolius]XP_019460595.1 PREDICTED: AT-hook motif nuclear-localized protein 9-like isoform X1 [Lupinus angustifolius]XP_019460596.1 PREDICTED: AT-hook motif nuclear-localized protein 9-like isoform X1
MDRGDQMALSGSASYYMQRGIPGSGQQPELHNSPNLRPMPNPNLPFQSNIGGPMESTGILSQTVNVVAHSGAPTGESVKRKRGRPRKYGTGGTVSLTLTPSPITSASHPGTLIQTQGQKRGRGRPPGSGKKQQLASLGKSLGELMSGSAGMGFTPHIVTVGVGEDIATKIMAFSQQGPRAICILSATGAVSTVTLRQSSTSGGTVTYEGCFEILCLSGSYLLTDGGGSRNRTGGLSVSLAGPDGCVIGGGIGGVLIASSQVQVIIGSFISGGLKAKKMRKEASEIVMVSDHQAVHNPVVAVNSISSNQNFTPSSSPSPWPASRPLDMRNSHIDIDLMRG